MRKQQCSWNYFLANNAAVTSRSHHHKVARQQMETLGKKANKNTLKYFLKRIAHNLGVHSLILISL